MAVPRNFVADAAAVASPAVVNLVCTGKGEGGISGSGFIYSKEGYVVTNAHVVESSPSGNIVVTMWNGKKRKGTVHSMDKLSDIALVKLTDVKDDEDLPVAEMGSSSTLRHGEFVIALGSPLRLQNTVTFGIVSATARLGSELGMTQNRTEYIQTDAAINRGNSGGPLVNLDGAVVGIVTFGIRDSDGVSFAIPIDVAQQVIKQLLEHKRVIRPYAGLKMATFQPSPWVLVVDVDKDSPAQRGGLQSGDLIVQVNGKTVSGVGDVLDAIGSEVGKTVEFGVKRQTGEDLLCKVTLAPEQKKSKL